MAVFQGLELTAVPRREVLWDKTTCAGEDQQQDYSDQGDYCIYHFHDNLFTLLGEDYPPSPPRIPPETQGTLIWGLKCSQLL